MEDGRPSKTALTMAVLRAHHYLSTQEPRVLNDSLVMQLAGMASAAEVSAHVNRLVETLAAFGDRSAAQEIVQDMTMCACARGCFVEDQLATSLARGMKQLVILGAGLDSTVYRCSNMTDGLAVFEVDFPATQAWKRERLASIGVSIPRNLTFVPFDFERQTMAEALVAGGVRADQMSFFSWLGVQPYLTDDAVMSTLDVIANFPSGSELVLDLLTPNHIRHSESMEGILQVLARIGEPFKSTYELDLFNTRLKQRGLTQIDMVSIHDWFLRHSARFHGRFSANLSPSILVSAQVA